MSEDDLGALVSFAEAVGYHLDEAVQVLFTGKKPGSTCPVPNPAIRPEEKQIYGLTVPVAPVADLVTMKMNSLRDKGKVQLRILDKVGLITQSDFYFAAAAAVPTRRA